MFRGMRVAISVVLLIGSVGSAFADGPKNLNSVIVHGTTIDGWKVICSGSACGNIVFENTIRYNTNQPEMGEAGGGVSLNVDKEQFCAMLAKDKPSGCNLAVPPASPGIVMFGQPAWQPNGCGLGGWKDALLSAVAGFAGGHNYSGELDAPRDGVSFLAACNEHDRCYTAAEGKAGCATAFQLNMYAQCGGDALCDGWADVYAGIVKVSSAAEKTYNSSVEDRSCALFAKDMRSNGCRA